MKIVITHAVRTPIGAFLGGLKQFSAVELGRHAVSALLERSGIAKDQVDALIFGNGRQAGGGTNPARQILIGCGIPESSTAMTINKACGSGLESILQAARLIRGGEAEIIVAGGTESMTRVPFELDLREGLRLGHATLHDGNFRDGFTCPLTGKPMGLTAEALAEKYEISREEQDEYAVVSQQKAAAARQAGRFEAEIAPVRIEDRKGNVTIVSADEHPRDGVTVEKLAKLPAVFKRGGTVHAGNSSGITDGAACVLVMSEEKAAQLGLPVMAALDGWTDAGVDPQIMGIGPVPAVRRYLDQFDSRLSDFDLIELNEAFAAQVIACDRELKLPHDRLNVNGGAIALGHPIGMTGCRIVVTLLHEMVRRDARRGLATLCISGGLGMAAGFSR